MVREKSGKIGKIREKSGKMNYYNYSVAAIIVQTIIADYNNSTIDHSQLIFCSLKMSGKVREFDHDWRLATLKDMMWMRYG